jgi:predicted MFS family arabinose efflux permease
MTRSGSFSTQHLWREFLTCLATILMLAVGEGAFLLLIVAYLENHHVPVAETGSVMAFLSIVEGVTCLLTGFLFRGKYAREAIALSLLVQGSGALILAGQPTGAWVWLGAGVNGAGMGTVSVALYAATLERRPPTIPLGLAIGLYTAGIAAGNGLGATLCGIVTDRYGFGLTFALSASAIMVMALAALTLSRQARAAVVAQSQDVPAALKSAPAHGGVWVLAVISAFTLAGINTAFDTLFPIYGLRAGMTMTVIGSLAGLKGFLAAVVRPFSGAILARANTLRLNNWSLAGLAGTTMLVPLLGLSAAFTALVGSMGFMFGASRVISATLLLEGQDNSRLTSRRISFYNTALDVGAIVGPWAGGWVAWWVGLPSALAIVPGGLLGIYLAALWVLPRLARHRHSVGYTRI